MLAVFIGQFVLKATIILAIGWGLAAALSRASAATRHLVWLAAVCATLALPAVALYGPRFSLPIPSVQLDARAIGRPAPPTVSFESEQPRARASILNQREVRTRPVAGRWASAIVILWITIGAVGVLKLIAALVWASVMARQARPITDSRWLALMEQTRQALGLNRRVALRTSAHTMVPLTCGIWRGVVLLPADAEHWSTERRRIVLLHELAHVRRRDCLSRACARLGTAIHWFNPLAHVAARRVCAEQERACDDVVLAEGICASDYANHLFDIVRGACVRSAPLRWATVAMGRSSQLEERMLSLLHPTHRRGGPSMRVRALVAIATTAAVLLVGGLQLTATQHVVNGPSGPMRDRSIREWARYVEPETRARVAIALTAGLSDVSAEVREAINHALDFLHQQPAGRVLVTTSCRGDCFGAHETLWTYGWYLWAAWGLSSPDAGIRKDTLMNSGVFLRSSKSGVAALAQALMDGDRGVRTWAAIRLDSVPSADALPAWIALLNDSDASLRERAVISLGAIGDPLAIDALTSTLLNDAEPVVRRQAARSLGRIAFGEQN